MENGFIGWSDDVEKNSNEEMNIDRIESIANEI
jgi:hypothetical protein